MLTVNQRSGILFTGFSCFSSVHFSFLFLGNAADSSGGFDVSDEVLVEDLLQMFPDTV